MSSPTQKDGWKIVIIIIESNPLQYSLEMLRILTESQDLNVSDHKYDLSLVIGRRCSTLYVEFHSRVDRFEHRHERRFGAVVLVGLSFDYHL